MNDYPPEIAIRPISNPIDATVRPPGSKSITNRAFVLAALACRSVGAFRLTGVLRSEDTEVMVDSLRKLGFRVAVDWEACAASVSTTDSTRVIPAQHADLFVANSGTTMRFLTAMVALGNGRYRLDGVPRMRERPIQDLIDALRILGVKATSEAGAGCPPVVVESDGLAGGTVRIRGDISSQFLTGLLMAAAFADDTIRIDVNGTLVSIPYVTMTLEMMRAFGLDVTSDDNRSFTIAGQQKPSIAEYAIEPDASAASYFFGAAAITGGQVAVEGLSLSSLQGDVRFVRVLEQMGCAVTMDEHRIVVRGRPLHGIDVDMNDISDTVMTLGAVACFANGPTNIRNVGHIRHKETDRIAALANELRAVGARVDERSDGLTITPGPLHGARIRTYDDHRMAMSLALVGLRVPGIVILDPKCVAKTYPRFFDDLERVTA